jgi:uncharacterized membrane protein
MTEFEVLKKDIENVERHLSVLDEKLNIILRILKENGGVIYDKD